MVKPMSLAVAHRTSNMFAPFFARASLSIKIEDHIKPEEVTLGLIVKNDGDKFYIVTNETRYKNYLAKIEEHDEKILLATRTYLDPESLDYDEHIKLIGVQCFDRSEIPPESLHALRFIYESINETYHPLMSHKEF